MSSPVHRSVRSRQALSILIGIAVLLLSAACASTSYAPEATSAVDSLRSTYLSAIIGVSIIMISALGMCTARGVLSTEALVSWLVKVVVASVLGFAFAHTVLGQYADWWVGVLMASGNLGTAVVAVQSFLNGLLVPISSLVFYVALFGDVYPRAEPLSLMLVPLLLGHAAHVVVALVAASLMTPGTQSATSEVAA